MSTNLSTAADITLARECNGLFNQFIGKAADSIEFADKLGERLIEIKAELGHGKWTNFVEAHLEFSVRQAQNLMVCHREVSKMSNTQLTAYLKQRGGITNLIKAKPKQGKTERPTEEEKNDTDSGRDPKTAHNESDADVRPESSGASSVEDGDEVGGSGAATGRSEICPTGGDHSPIRDREEKLEICPKISGPHQWIRDESGDVRCNFCYEPGHESDLPEESQPDATPEPQEQPVLVFEVFDQGWVRAFLDFWEHCPAVARLAIKEAITESTRRKRFEPPTTEAVAQYCYERGRGVDAQKFVDFYSAKGWMIGKNKMKDWKAAVRTWEKGENGRPDGQAINQGVVEQALQEIQDG